LKTSGVSSVTSFHSITARSVRIDATALKSVGFSSLKKLPADFKKYVKAEKLIESGDRSVKNLVASTLPRNFQKSLPIVTAAQRLFQAVVARISYVESPSGLPSAALALRSGQGDCGFFAAAFTAACRQAGIPARPITGFMVGTNAWHVWAEFYVPAYGWIPVDPSFADGLDPAGQYSLYFGIIPELNQRVATAIGFDHSFGKVKAPILQSPMALVDPARVSSFQTWASLTEIP
jgi:hypothetical protein